MQSTISIIIFICIQLTKASITDEELKNFIASDGGIKKLNLLVNYKPIGNTDLELLVDATLDQVKDQPAYRNLAEQYIKIQSKFILEYGQACDKDFVNYKDASNKITMTSLIKWYDFLKDRTSVELCNFEHGLVCLQGKCNCSPGEIYEEKRCFRPPDFPCDIVDWGSDSDKKLTWSNVVKILPTTLMRPEPSSPCIPGTVCKKLDRNVFSSPRCICFDRSKTHCASSSAFKGSVEEDFLGTSKISPTARIGLGERCKTIKSEELAAFQEEVKRAYTQQSFALVSPLAKDFCHYEKLETCEARSSGQVCSRTTILCIHVQGARINPEHCEDYMITCDKPTCQIQNTFHPVELPVSTSLTNHPYGECMPDTIEIPFARMDSAKSSPENVCWCKDKSKYGKACKLQAAFFGTLFNPSIYSKRNSFGFTWFDPGVDEKEAYPMLYYQKQMNYWLTMLENLMVLKLGDTCDEKDNSPVEEITWKYFGLFPTLTQDQIDAKEHKDLWIEDESKLEELKKLVNPIPTPKLCNFKMLQHCENTTCTSILPPDLIPIPAEEGHFAYAAGQKDCDKPQPTLPPIFGNFAHKCVPNAICTQSCKDPDKDKYMCICEKGFTMKDKFCEKIDNPSDSDNLCEDFYKSEIRELQKQLKLRQTLKIHKFGCNVEFENDLQTIINTDPKETLEIRQLLRNLLNKASISQPFCDASKFLKCHKYTRGFVDGICLCFDGMAVSHDNHTCSISRGLTCGQSWKLPSFLNFSSSETTQPRCKSQRCYVRKNGTFTCNPDPWSSAFKHFEGKATVQTPLTILSLVLTIIFAHNLAS